MACKTTSRKVSKTASRLLKDNRTSKAVKSVSGSALSQAKRKKK